MVGGTGDEYVEYDTSSHIARSSNKYKAYVVRTDGNGNLL